MKEQLRLAALHESGHVGKSFIDGAKISSVCINSDGTGEAISNHPIFKTLHLISWKNLAMVSFVSCQLAGPACELYAEGKLSTGSLPLHCYDDVETARHYMESRGWKPPSGNYTCNDFFRDYGGAAKYFAIAYSKEVSLLADELFEKRQMSGQECVLFLEKIWSNPLPSKCLRHYEHKK